MVVGGISLVAGIDGEIDLVVGDVGVQVGIVDGEGSAQVEFIQLAAHLKRVVLVVCRDHHPCTWLAP